MRKLAAVEEARALMEEAMEWGLWRWLLEKRRVREVADRATDALNEADVKTKAGWSDELKRAYEELVTDEPPRRGRRQGRDSTLARGDIPPDVRVTAKSVKEADDRAERARLNAEDTFDEAERRMSTDLACEGARKALHTYDLREAAIRKAEGAARGK
ncbi:MAG TPA: hypothetical protein VEI26_15080 [Terriglobales bacterium]|nr:hypothetical protein [Terriglobales bacterium]